MKLPYYIASFRLRTLPLSLSGIFLGSLLAAAAGCFSETLFAWGVATTLSLQILSNLANELGDLLKGTDNEARLGPIRSVQKGLLSKREMGGAILFFVLLSAFCGSMLLLAAYRQSGDISLIYLFLVLGAAAIVSALTYTLGKRAYGYRGWGDLFVFLFFGWLSTAGIYWLYCGGFSSIVFLPATAVGLLSVGVLNLNNMRDRENDALCGKRTLPVRLGERGAKLYHTLLLLFAFLAAILFVFMLGESLKGFLFLLLLPYFAGHLYAVWHACGRRLDKQMPVLSFGTLLFALLLGMGIYWGSIS